MRPIHLLEYGKTLAGVVFDLESNTVVSRITSVPADLRGFSGFCGIRAVGLWRKELLTTALFLMDNDQPRLVVGNFVATLGSSSVFDVRLRKRMLFHRELVIKYGGKSVSFRYWWTTSEVWPDDGDIFRYISEALNDSNSVAQFISYWRTKRNASAA